VLKWDRWTEVKDLQSMLYIGLATYNTSAYFLYIIVHYTCGMYVPIPRSRPQAAGSVFTVQVLVG